MTPPVPAGFEGAQLPVQEHQDACLRKVFDRAQLGCTPYSSHREDWDCRSAGKKQEFDGETYTIEELTDKRQAASDAASWPLSQLVPMTPQPSHTVTFLCPHSFAGVDIALFSAGGSISKSLGPVARDAGCIVSVLTAEAASLLTLALHAKAGPASPHSHNTARHARTPHTTPGAPCMPGLGLLARV